MANCSEQAVAKLSGATTAQPHGWLAATLYACPNSCWHVAGWRLRCQGLRRERANTLQAQRNRSQNPGHGRLSTRLKALYTRITRRVSCGSDSASAHLAGMRTLLADGHPSKRTMCCVKRTASAQLIGVTKHAARAHLVLVTSRTGHPAVPRHAVAMLITLTSEPGGFHARTTLAGEHDRMSGELVRLTAKASKDERWAATLAVRPAARCTECCSWGGRNACEQLTKRCPRHTLV